MKKIIAVIDIYGVITNLDFMIFKNISSKIINIGHHHTVDNKLLNDIFFKICLSVAKNSRLRPDVKEVITALKNNGVEMNIVTKRPFATTDSKEGFIIRTLTESLLDNAEIPYDRLFFSDGDKVFECDDLEADFIIEDNPQTVYELAKHTKVILFNTPYNHGIEGENIYIVNSWIHAFDIIMNLFPLKERILKLDEEN